VVVTSLHGTNTVLDASEASAAPGLYRHMCHTRVYSCCRGLNSCGSHLLPPAGFIHVCLTELLLALEYRLGSTPRKCNFRVQTSLDGDKV
jgi:hypothetical protein